jgi:SPP1 family predicted phage head-tail adaptor
MSLSAGKLRHRLRIEEYVALEDSHGDPIQDATTGEISKAWETVATVWGAIEPLSAREYVQSGAKQSEMAARITIRYRSGLTAAMRFVHVVNGVDGEIYNPAGILPDYNSLQDYLTIPCGQGVNEGE